jgi:hypothetical protein
MAVLIYIYTNSGWHPHQCLSSLLFFLLGEVTSYCGFDLYLSD